MRKTFQKGRRDSDEILESVNSNSGFKVNQIITVSSLQMFFFLFKAFVLCVGSVIINSK